MLQLITEEKVKEELSTEETGLDLLLKNAEDIQKYCEDELIVPKDQLFINDEIMGEIDVEGNRKGYHFSQYSMAQLCNKLGIPTRYITKCMDSEKEQLARYNLDSWLAEMDKPVLVRTYKNMIRGILSDRYSTFDTPEIIKVLQRTIPSDFNQVQSHFLTPERFHLRLIRDTKLNIGGEDLYAGIQIDSSDVGRSTLVAQFFVFKSSCTNGMVFGKIGGEIFRQKHIGITTEDFEKGLEENLDIIEPLVAKAEKMISLAKESTISKEQFKDTFEMIKNQSKMSDEALDKVIDLVEEKYSREGSYDMWGISNGITEVAQNYTLERRIELEKFAGSLVEKVSNIA